MEGRVGMDIHVHVGDVGVSLHFKTHPLYTLLCTSVSKLVSCAFSTIPMSLFKFVIDCNTYCICA